jgi:acetylglutamate kinase
MNGAQLTPALPRAAEAVLTFLESVGRRSEAQLYLELFLKLPRESFGIIAPGAPVVLRGQGTFSTQLRFLQDLGLCAPVVLGLFDPKEAVSAAERVAKRLEGSGVRVPRVSANEPDIAGRLKGELATGAFPLVELGEEGELADRIRWLSNLAGDLDSRKLVFLRRRGALRVESERATGLAQKQLIPLENGAISLVNLETDAELVEARWLKKDDRALLDAARSVLGQSRASRLVVSVTSPLDLLRELFTVRGAGTLIKRGTTIQRFYGYADLDASRLSSLLSTSFQHPLKEDFFEKTPLAVYVEEEFRAAAVLLNGDVAPYLSKFAVEPLAQGEGMGRDLWQAILRDFPRMFWRTRADNPIASWYSAIADGLWRGSEWHVFWRGMQPDVLPRLIEHALSLPDDFTRS